MLVNGVAATLIMALLGTWASSARAVIFHVEDGTTLSYQPAPSSQRAAAGARTSAFDTFFSNLDYSGGPIMPSNKDYTLYWSPSGGSAYPLDFRSGVNAYFEALAHDSGGHANVDSVATQYNDAAGTFVKYQTEFGGELLDEHAYPANGCTRATRCLTDKQIREEIVRYVAEKHLPTGYNVEYFLLTPQGVESCFEAAGLICSANATEHREYCAYHGDAHLVGGGNLVYSNDPFVNNKNCDEPFHHINGTSDSALFGGLSHEHVESITDPEPNNAWTDWGGTGGEIGDKCRTFEAPSEFGTLLGEVEGLAYNQEINGRKYWYQQEWSNKGTTCLQRLTFSESEAPTAKFTIATGSGNTIKVDATGSTVGSRYVWQFNDRSGHHENETIETSGLTLEHTLPTSETYLVALTVYKPDGTSKGAAQLVTPGKLSQTITFSSSPPAGATVGGTPYSVSAAGGGSGNPVAFAIDPSSAAVCSISGSIVQFIGAGSCEIDATQLGNGSYSSALEVKQVFAVGRGSQTIGFTSAPPTGATVGGAGYLASAGASSGLPVTLSIDGASAGVCTLAGSAVRFVGAGPCVIDANQGGDANYTAAVQAQQSFGVEAAPGAIAASVPVVAPPLVPSLPNSTFGTGQPFFNQTTGVLTFAQTVSDPGTFSWLLTFQNGKFGVFAASSRKCKAGQVRLGGKCRPSKVVFAKGSQLVATPGNVTFKLKPSPSALKALKNALKQKKGLSVTATFTFQSAHGGSPVSRTLTTTVKLKKH
ncbi:MAG TPA: hypothetical protein VGO14_06860 [Solirubrobacteraceae bacterium]|nr:hypothetical protein [Solirubrobacteraceae bacterium]